MTLELPNIPQIFKHSKDIKTGCGNVRIGQASIIVGKEGICDFDDIQEAINSVTTEGALIYIKAGTYVLDGLDLKSNIALEGEGEHTILTIGITTSANQFGKLDLSSRDGITIKNMTINFVGDWSAGSWYSCKLDSTTDLMIENVNFVNKVSREGAGDVGFFRATTGTSTLNLINCNFSNADGGGAESVFIDTAMTDSLIIGNKCDTDIYLIGDTGYGGDVTINRIIGNKCKGISILGEAGQNIDKNILMGNELYQIEFGDAGTADKNIISNNFLWEGGGSRIYLGANSNKNAVTGNVHDAANTDAGAGNITSGDVQY